MARTLVGLVFLAAGLAKTHELVTGGAVHAQWVLLETQSAKIFMSFVDFIVAGLLFSRLWRVGCLLAVVVVVGGNAIYAWSMWERGTLICGCYGKVPLSPRSHAALSVVVFTLATWTWIGDPLIPRKHSAE